MFSSFPLLLSLWPGQRFSSPQVYQIYILGYSDNDCLCFCYQQGDGEFGGGGCCGAFHYRHEPSLWPHVFAGCCFIATNLFTELITNNAAAALMVFRWHFPSLHRWGVRSDTFLRCNLWAASASFSPIGYQTNLIVQGIGNYKFTDFVRIGLPLNIITF